MALLFSPPAHAGTYSVTYSGGQFALTTSSGTPSTLPYALTNGQWGGSGTGYWNYGNGSAVAQGAITATFTWQSTDSDDVPPLSVIVVDHASASWNLAGADASNSCADGLGDPQVVNGSNGSSSGIGYQVVQNPGASFTVSRTPSVNVTGTGYPHYGSATVAVYYAANAVPVVITVGGTTRFNNVDNVLIGQQVTASLSIGNYQQSNWQWAASGDPFAGFVTTATTGNAVELTPAMKQQANFLYYYRSVSGGAVSTLTCAATITLNGTQQQVTATKNITVAVPTFSFTPTKGATNVWTFTFNNPPNPPTTEIWLEPFNRDTSRGMNFLGSVTTPYQFIGEEGSGNWAIAQILDQPQFSYTDNNNTVHQWPFNGKTGLDTRFPYGNKTWTADGTQTHTGDTPGIQLETTIMSKADDANTFETYFLYQPPSADGASNVTWVPLYEIDWNWHGAASFDNPTQTWLPITKDGVNQTKNAATTTLPTWTLVINTAVDF